MNTAPKDFPYEKGPVSREERYTNALGYVDRLIQYRDLKSIEFPEWSRETLLRKIAVASNAKRRDWGLTDKELVWIITQLEIRKMNDAPV